MNVIIFYRFTAVVFSILQHSGQPSSYSIASIYLGMRKIAPPSFDVSGALLWMIHFLPIFFEPGTYSRGIEPCARSIYERE